MEYNCSLIQVDWRDATNVIKPTQPQNNLQEINILRYKTMEQLKNLKNGPFSYLCLAKTNHTYHQKPNPSRDTVRYL